MDLKIIYEDDDVLVVDKPAGIIVFAEGKNNDGESHRTIVDLLLGKYPELADVGDPPRYGIVHRLDKDTSGILLVAKSNEALIFLQKQFKNRTVEKKYVAMATGDVKENNGRIETLIGRSPADPRKQKTYPIQEIGTGRRIAITEYKVLQRFAKFTLLEVAPKTGRKHQIRCHLASIHCPIVRDKMYGFKDSPVPEGLERQFLHASYIKIKLPNRQTREFNSELPEELKQVLNELTRI